jgi:hypothetical protein
VDRTNNAHAAIQMPPEKRKKKAKHYIAMVVIMLFCNIVIEQYQK